MVKTIILQTLLYMILNIVCFVVGAICNKFLTLNQASIITLILLILNFIWLIIRVCKRKNSLKHQPNLSIQSTKTKKSSKTTSTKPTPINKEIVIEYSDSTGDITTRRIRVKEIKYDKYKRKMVPYSLYSYCFVKKAPRTFVIHNIISAYDAETGEIISDIPKYLMQ